MNEDLIIKIIASKRDEWWEMMETVLECAKIGGRRDPCVYELVLQFEDWLVNECGDD